MFLVATVGSFFSRSQNVKDSVWSDAKETKIPLFFGGWLHKPYKPCPSKEIHENHSGGFRSLVFRLGSILQAYLLGWPFWSPGLGMWTFCSTPQQKIWKKKGQQKKTTTKKCTTPNDSKKNLNCLRFILQKGEKLWLRALAQKSGLPSGPVLAMWGAPGRWVGRVAWQSFHPWKTPFLNRTEEAEVFGTCGRWLWK